MPRAQQSSQPRRSSAQQPLGHTDAPARRGQRRIDLEEFCTSAMAAKRYCFSRPRFFVEWAARRNVPFEWYGGRKLYRWSDLEALREPGNAVAGRRAS